MSNLSEQEIIRREKLKKIRELGINPYPADLFNISHNSKSIKSNFIVGQKVIIAGRLMSRRIQGNASFAELQDSSGRIQVYFNRDEICLGDDKSKYNDLYKKLLDIGDIIGIDGELFKTKVGEMTILVKDFKLLSKSLKPLPLPKTDSEGNVYDEFSSPELRYRQRYVDLIVNDSVKDTFLKRSKIISSIRATLENESFIEVETPILQPIPGGAAAKPFITHHNSLNIPLYMRIANELYLKRLIVGGFDGVFEFAKDFRNEGMDRTHNPEFTNLEFYVSYKDYNWMMDFTERLLEKVALDTHGSSKVIYGNKEIDFKGPYKKIGIIDAIKNQTGIDALALNEKELAEAAKKIGIEIDDTMGKGKIIDEIFGEKCEANFIQPTFIIDYPKEMSPLTKEHRTNPKLTERFELLINGSEIANAYSELNDPIDQLERFEDQLKLSEKGDEEAMFIDHDFVRSLEYGMPPTSGIGIGIDRLVMLLTNHRSIQEVIFFPQMKPENKESKIDLNENEKSILEEVKNHEKIELITLKNSSGLSNKKWDKSIKHLTKNNLVKVSKNEFGVISSIPNYNLGLPASGLLIWHIDEKKINNGFKDYSINSDRQLRGIDLEEADGAQDMGYVSNLFTDPSSGYWGDMWFKENLEYFRANSNNSMDFTSFTYPNTKSNSKANSGIYISDISNAGKTMSFNLTSSYNIKVIADTSKSILFQWDINDDGNLDFIGFGDSLWWGSSLKKFKTFNKSSNNNYQTCIVQNSSSNSKSLEVAFISHKNNDSIFEWFEFDIDNENFNIKWSYKLENINNLELLKADIEGVWVKQDDKLLLVNNEGVVNNDIDPNLLPYTSSLSSPIILNNNKIIINKLKIKDGNYKSLSMIDLDNDQNMEIIAVDMNGNIHAFDLNLFSKNGFPLSVNAKTSVFSINLLDDKKRELVYQNNNGEIIVLNHEGKIIDIIASKDKLISLGTYEGKDGIFFMISYLPLFIVVICLISIFLFHNRVFQYKFSLLAFRFSLFMCLFTVFYFYYTLEGLIEMMPSKILEFFLYAAILNPFICSFLLHKAAKSIKKDDDLVSSLDRIR